MERNLQERNPKEDCPKDGNPVTIYQFLLKDSDRTELMHYCENRLYKLEQYDRENETALQETLLAYYKNGFSMVDTAKALGLHRNSLRYRMQKIWELLELAPDDYMAYLDLVNCLLVRRMLQK